MKHVKPIRSILACTSLALVAACSAGESQAAGADLDQVKEEARETWDALKDYAHGRRGDLEQTLRGELDRWSRNLESLVNEAEDATDDARANLKSRVEKLKSRRSELSAKLDELGDSSQAAWSELRDGVVASMEQLDRALREARASFDEASD